MPKVFIWRDGAVETEFDPGHRDWRIGRSETNDITLIDPRKSVSRFHAELREEHGRWIFIDLNSQNGSWKDGQRVNRLTLEHGHEVLFGDYKLAFHDVKPPAPPPPPPVPERGGQTGPRTNPPPPDQTLLMPGARSGAAPVAAGPPPPVARAARPTPPRKGVNPVILVLFLLAMLGVVAAVAYKLLTDLGPEEAPVVAETPPTPVAEAPPVTVPAEPTPETAAPATTTTTASEVVAPPAAPPPPPPPPAPVRPTTATPSLAPGATPTPTAGAPSGRRTTPPSAPVAPPPARPRRPPAAPAVPKDSPALVSRYDEGRRALTAGRLAEAERAFGAVLAQQPDFRDTAALLAQAREGQAAAREKQLAAAQALEAKGDWGRAVAAYEQAGATAQADAARTKMHEAGDDAYRKARQFDARNRPGEAITWYGRAVEWLPDADARKAAARERLAVLKGGAA